jgi:adenine-specific DNA-methyltransferase
VLEGESQETIGSQLSLLQERVLPDLGKNIQCGNSLIGPDYYEAQQLMMLIDEEERYRVNAFDWKRAFSQVFIQGGFDTAIGNPPYVFGGNYGIEQDDKKYFKDYYHSGSRKVNLFTLFIEKSVNVVRDGGLVSYIIPNTLLRVTSYAEIREFMLRQTAVRQIVDLGVGVFSGATTSSIIVVLEKAKEAYDNMIEIRDGIDTNVQLTQQSEFLANGYVLNTSATSQDTNILRKLNVISINLGELCQELIFGVVITKNRDDVVSDKSLPGYKPFLEGRDISRYLIRSVGKYLLYKPELLHRPRTPRIFEAREKLLIQRITGGKRPLNAAYDNQQFYNKESINNIILKDDTPYNAKYILGLLNSQLLNWFYRNKFTNESTLTVNLSKEYLSQIPIRVINFTDHGEKKRHDKMVSLVERMLELHKRKPRMPQEQEMVKREIQSTDNQIDHLVYELYGLTEEEVKVVAGN